MTQAQTTKILGIATFACLTMLAAVFYLERVGHIDMGFQAFLMLKDDSLAVQHGRFGVAVTQVWPWLAQRLSLPLPTVLLAYSLGHVLWPALVFGWCCCLRAWRWALVLLLVTVGMPTHTFYFLSELPQGLAFLLGLFAWMDSRAESVSIPWWQRLLWLAAIVTAFYFHPLVLYAAVFGCAFFLCEPLRRGGIAGLWATPRPRLFLATLGYFALVMLAKYKLLKLNWYDAVALERTKAYGQLWPHWWDIQSNRDLLQGLATDYWFVPVAGLLAVGFYFWQKNWLKAALLLVYPLVYVLLVNVPFQEGGEPFYMENLWLPLGFFVSVPLVFDVLPGLGWSVRTQFAVLAVVLGLGLWRITLAHRPWTARLTWEQDFLQKTATLPAKKLILDKAKVPMQTLKMEWAMPYEFLLLSSLDGPAGARCILVTPEPARYDSLLTRPRLFLGTFKNYDFEALPARYFQLQDTSAYLRW